ncbi:hypothetical protein ABZP36_002618 [Zizania latifolia]
MASDLLNSTGSSYMILRDVFHRLVFCLQLDASLSMEMIAFWLWLEGSGHTDFLKRIGFLDDDCFQAIASAAKSFVETLNLDRCDLGDRSAPRSPFQREVIEGISFYLNNICYKALSEDLRGRQEMDGFQHQICQAYEADSNDPVDLSTKDLLSKIRCLYANTQEHHEEGPSYRSIQYPRKHIVQDKKVARDEYAPASYLASFMDTLSLRKKHNDAVMQKPYNDVPEDERTLFVTFSNGYPLSKDELYDFFMRHYGDVEDITIEEPPEPRPPLFAQVVFSSQLTLLRVLGGNKRVKFMTRGRHVWARQYVPKKKKEN